MTGLRDTAQGTVPTVCPACGSPDLLPAVTALQVNTVCSACGACWHEELGWLRAVDPTTCPGCTHRGVCMGHVGEVKSAPDTR